VRATEKHDCAIPMIVKKIQAASLQDTDRAQVVLATAHKAKGLEWQNVVLANDFAELAAPEATPRGAGVDTEEVNILYVAATRARRVLELNEGLERLFGDLKPSERRTGATRTRADWAQAASQ
jgi:F-box protein, helicase, 18